VTVLADDDVVVHGKMPNGVATSAIALVIWMSACEGEASYFDDKTLRMYDGWLILTSKRPPHLRRPFVPGWAGDDLFQPPCAIEPDQ